MFKKKCNFVSEAVDKLGTEFDEHVETHDICEITNSGGVCGV